MFLNDLNEIVETRLVTGNIHNELNKIVIQHGYTYCVGKSVVYGVY